MHSQTLYNKSEDDKNKHNYNKHEV